MHAGRDLLQRLVAAGRLSPAEAGELLRLDPGRLTAHLGARGLLPPSPGAPLAPSLGNSPPPGGPRRGDLVLSEESGGPPSAPELPGLAPLPGPASVQEAPRRRVGRYLLQEELGRGGMGVVWRALDPQLQREVALKMLLPAEAEGPEQAARRRERFQREARAAARLRHPHVVTVHEVGEDQGGPFLVMDLVRGSSLEAILTREGRLAPRRAAEVVREVALGLEAAHGEGIVHRDVKPGNVLIEGGSGRALLSDFGLARDVSAAERQLSHSGQLIGTPDYLSPEQVRGEREVGPPSDVWALGGLLYKALTGEVPFPAETLGQLMHRVLVEEPRPPRQLDPHLHPDLETIALKCLEKDLATRYATAGEVAAELGRFLQGEALLARPLGRRELLARWARRNRALAATLGGSALLVLGLLGLGVIGALVSVGRIRAERDRAESARVEAERDRARAEAEERRASAAGAEARAAAADAARESRAKGELLARALRDRGDRFREEGRYHEAAALYAASLARGESPGARSGMLAALGHASRALRCASPVVVTTLVAAPDGRCLAGGTRGLLHADRLGPGGFSGESWGRSGEIELTCGQLSPGGDRVALGDASGYLRLLRLADGEELARWPAGEVAGQGAVAALAWSPGGQELCAALRDQSGVLRWTPAGRALPPLEAPAGVLSLAFAPDGATLLAGTVEGQVLALDPALRAAPRALGGSHAGPVIGLVVCGAVAVSASPADGLLAQPLDAGAPPGAAVALPVPQVTALCASGPWVTAGTRGGELHQWRPQDGARRGPYLPKVPAAITAVAAAEEGARLVYATRASTLEALDAASGRVLDAELIVSGRAVARIRPGEISLGGLRGMGGGELLLRARPGQGGVPTFSADPEGEVLRAWSADGSTTVVVAADARLRRAGQAPVALAGAPPLVEVFLSPEGQRAWTVGQDGTLRVWDGLSGREVLRPISASRPLVAAASQDGARLVASDPDAGTLQLFDSRSGEQLTRWSQVGRVESLAIHPQAGFVVSAAGPQLFLHRVEDQGEPGPLLTLRAPVTALQFTPNGQQLAIGTTSGDVELWRFDALPQRLRVLAGLGAPVTAVAFAPDSERMVAATDEGEVMLWELDAFPGTFTEALPGHVNALDLDPAAPRLFLGTADGMVILVDWERGEGYRIAPSEPASPIYRLRASPDGGSLAAVFLDGPARAWRVPRGGTPEELPPLPPCRDVAWTARGELWALCADGRVVRGGERGPLPPARERGVGEPRALAGLAWTEPGRLNVGARGAVLALLASAPDSDAPARLELGHPLPADHLVGLPGGALLVGASERLLSGDGRGPRVSAARTEDLHELTLVAQGGRPTPLTRGSGLIHSLSAGAGGRRAVLACAGRAEVWDLERRAELFRLELRPDGPLLGLLLTQARAGLQSGRDAPVFPAALSAGGDVLATGWPAHQVRVWFLGELGALAAPAEVAAVVERRTGFRVEGVEVAPVDPALDDPRWARAGR